MEKTISILVPSRGRPDLLNLLLESLKTNSETAIEVLVYLDDDDSSPYNKAEIESNYPFCKLFVGPSKRVGIIWNELAALSTGKYLMMGNDDLVFTQTGWDSTFIATVEKHLPQDFFVAWANDSGPSDCSKRCCFPIIPRHMYNVLQYFAPTCFNFLYHDTWLHAIGMRINRCFYLPNVVIDHRHFAFKKAEYDETYRRHRVGKKQERQEDADTFERTDWIRQEHANKLLSVIKWDGRNNERT